MGDDDSIDEFATAADANDTENASADTDDANDDDEPGPEPEGVAPTETIYRWTPRTATCEACGASAKRRWRDDGAMVCSDCKEW